MVACVTEALAAESFEKGTRPAMHGVLEKKKNWTSKGGTVRKS
jgi:hypothetical protein